MSLKFSLAAIETAKQTLDALPAPAKDTREVGLRGAIQALSPTIRRLIRRGYSRRQVVELLNEQGVTLSMSTLKQYFRDKPIRGGEGAGEPPAESRGPVQHLPKSHPGADRGSATVGRENTGRSG
jgi:hypothetical protein